MKLVNEFCRPMDAPAIAFAESLPFTVYTHGYAQTIKLTRGDDRRYAPTFGVLYSDRTPPPKDFLKPGEQILETPVEMYHYDPGVSTQHTHCPYPVEHLQQCGEGCLLPPPIFEGQLIRHDVYNVHAHRRGMREYVSVRLGERLEWLLLSEWTLDKSA